MAAPTASCSHGPPTQDNSVLLTAILKELQSLTRLLAQNDLTMSRDEIYDINSNPTDTTAIGLLRSRIRVQDSL